MPLYAAIRYFHVIIDYLLLRDYAFFATPFSMLFFTFRCYAA